MQTATTWFEIPVRDLDAARRFYETLLGRPMTTPEGFGGEPMVLFAYEHPGVGGCLVERPAHRAATGGTIVYLDCTPSVEAALQRARAAGGEVVVERTLITPEIGYFAQIRDPEGNLVGLHAAD